MTEKQAFQTFGALRLAQLVLPTLRAECTGRIVNLSAMGGRIVIPFIGSYNASTFALEAMSDALWLETRPFGVRVIQVEPEGVQNRRRSAHSDFASYHFPDVIFYTFPATTLCFTLYTHPTAKTGGAMLEIKILGAHCAGCEHMRQTVIEALLALAIREASLEVVTEDRMGEYRLLADQAPALLIDGYLAWAGAQPTLDQVMEVICRALTPTVI